MHDRQHYRLIGWRNGICGYRRFFSITSLAGLRQEDRAVFDATHVEVKRWFDEGLVDGVRIDHPDGLSDPAGYLTWLREITGPQAWIVIEKILAVDEPLDPSLPVAGTTGYDALREIGGLLHRSRGRRPAHRPRRLDRRRLPRDAAAGPQRSRSAPSPTPSRSELARLCRAIVGRDRIRRIPSCATPSPRCSATSACTARTISNLSSVLPVALAETVAARPELAEPLAIVSAAVGAGGEAAVRLQQLCGAATAKSMEDCLFYRDPRLVSLNEVGGEPDRFGVSIAEFHQRAAVRARAVAAGDDGVDHTRHQARRGRAGADRGAVTGAVAVGASSSARGSDALPSPDPMTGLFLWQNIFGVWPVDGTVTDELRDRLHAYAEKAIREAAVHTTWNDPDAEFEHKVHAWIDAVIDGPIATELTSLVARLDEHARSDSLGQKLIQLTAPGVPDVYQGTELWDDSLVDPDNRRPVDFDRATRGAVGVERTPRFGW